MQKLNNPEHPTIPSLPPGIPPVPTVSETELRREVGAAMQRELQPILAALALVYLVVAFRLWLQRESALSQPLFLGALVSVGFALLVWILMRFVTVGSSWSYPMGAGLVLVILGNCYAQFTANPSPLLTTQLMLCLVAIGYLFRFTEWYLPLTLCALALWSYFAWTSNFSGLWPQFGVALSLTAVLAAWIHWNGSRTQRELLRLRLEEAPQRARFTKISEQASDDDKRFRGLWDLGFDALLLHDQGTILDANESLCSLLGYERAELIGAHFYNYLAEKSRAQFRGVSQFGNFQSAEAVALRKDGTRISIRLFNKPVPGEQGNISITAIRDLTEHKRQENLRLQEKDRLETVLRHQADVNRIELALDSSGALEDICRQVVESASSRVRISLGSCVLLSDGNPNAFGVCASTIPNVLTSGQSLKDIHPRSALGHVIDHKEPLIVPDTEVASFSLTEYILVSDLRAYAIFPINFRGAVAGFLVVLETEPRHYTPEELAYLEILASRIGVVLKRREIELKLYHAIHRIEEQDEEILRLRTTMVEIISA